MQRISLIEDEIKNKYRASVYFRVRTKIHMQGVSLNEGEDGNTTQVIFLIEVEAKNTHAVRLSY